MVSFKLDGTSIRQVQHQKNLLYKAEHWHLVGRSLRPRQLVGGRARGPTCPVLFLKTQTFIHFCLGTSEIKKTAHMLF